MKLKLIFLQIRKDSGGKGVCCKYANWSKDQSLGDSKEVLESQNTRFVLHDLDQEAKEKALFSQSERIAILNGLTNTPPGTTFRIVRNLRIRGDCYNLIDGIQKSKEIFWKELFLKILVYYLQCVLRFLFQDCNNFIF